MNRVGIVDIGTSNLDSMRRAIEECGGSPVTIDGMGGPADVDRLILPGVGAFHDAMSTIRQRGLDGTLRAGLDRGLPFLGVCLGLQLLATTGTEGGPTDGLGWIDASVERLEPGPGERVPHVGWNNVDAGPGCPLFEGIAVDADFYFVHSFVINCADDAHVAATTPYGGGFTSALQQENLFGVQFHPEKSQANGFALLRNFLAV